jgi:hydroxyethylthiazole kinase-like sugar kinase family protein
MWILDPLAMGFTDIRTVVVLDLLEIYKPAVIAANERLVFASMHLHLPLRISKH